MAVEARIKAKTKTGSRALYQPELIDVKSAGWDLRLSVDWEFAVISPPSSLSYHIAGALSFALKQLKVLTWKFKLLYFLAPGVTLWEICFALSWS